MKDCRVHRWWAQYLEAAGDLAEAKVFYLRAKDYLSLVRVHCCLGDRKTASTICTETGDAAACYHLARQSEADNDIDQAIHLYTRAKAYTSAVRLCKARRSNEHERHDHLFSLAQLGRTVDMIDAASHLERVPGYAGKAVLLYHKAGLISQAIQLAFRECQFSALQTVTASLMQQAEEAEHEMETEGLHEDGSNDSGRDNGVGFAVGCSGYEVRAEKGRVTERLDPALLRQCADFFLKNNQFDRAVGLLAAGRQVCFYVHH
ncbi:unnamed protein product [Protopolystoma xenopodis]|uniref:IF140/IFT172/WDR19 TPR domain-containing protein n=1 Tax=Protopolystoma xenopodis TaxID=117903 RepID=A0A448WMD5_9PLAT|nr:unnamed protein product [Protopolystoma xenopodis]